VADAFLAVLLAPSCLACGALLESPTRGPVCLECWRSVRALSPPLCSCCGEPLPASREPFLCRRCLAAPPGVSIGRSAGAYEGALRAIVHALKYDGHEGLARPLAALLRERAPEVLRNADCAVPVPLHWRRQFARGFNQAELIARGLGVPVVRALRRGRATRAQFGLTPRARRQNVRGAFEPARRHAVFGARGVARVAGARVVLVDDVTTTGATLRECAEALRRMGAREVRALTVARALRMRP